MTVSSSLNAGVMGLSVNSTRLSTISDNIANSDTVGYKRSVSEFQSMVVRSRPNAYSAGGVRVAVTRDVSDEGALISTGASTDIAIAGRGMLPVTDAAGAAPDAITRDLQLLPTGSFRPDQNGYLRTASGLFLLGFEADANGDIGAVSRQSSSSLVPVQINAAAAISTPTRNVGLGVNLPQSATEADGSGVAGPGATISTTTAYFDNFGNEEVLTFEFTPQLPVSGASNQWSVEIFDQSTGSPVSIGTFDIDFLDSQQNGGAIDNVTNNATYDPDTGEILVNVPSGPINVFIGRPNSNGGLTQTANDFAPTLLTRDGSGVGTLVNVEIDSAGRLEAIFNTGFRRTLYQIPVADVPNPDGLAAENGQAYRVSQASGSLYLWDAGDGPTGETVGFALMESTVDIASELTALIETQRAYSSNAKVIQTVDEILQETTNIIR